MKNKRLIIIISIVVILLVVLIYFLNNNNKIIEEYIPEEEISQEDSKKANVILFFQNKDTKVIEAESVNIDSKDLLLEPYKTIVELLIKGPENETLEKIIPEGVILNNVCLENYCLKIDFSKQFIDNCSEDEIIRKNIIDSIFNTVTQLNEVSSVKILIDGVENLGFPNSEVKF